MVPRYTQQVKYPNIRILYSTVGGRTDAHRQLAIKLHSFEILCSGTRVLTDFKGIRTAWRGFVWVLAPRCPNTFEIR